jgi:hypothetical protein
MLAMTSDETRRRKSSVWALEALPPMSDADDDEMISSTGETTGGNPWNDAGFSSGAEAEACCVF